jgi:hypothetical protein
MVQKDIGACFEIRVDGKTRSHRDRKETAIEAGRYLKQTQPQSEIMVRDVRDKTASWIYKASPNPRADRVFPVLPPRSGVQTLSHPMRCSARQGTTLHELVQTAATP